MSWNLVLSITDKVTRRLSIVSGISLTFAMLLTVLDILLRAIGHPLMGVFETIGLTGALVIGFSIPLSSWTRTHVYMEFVVNRLSRRGRNVMHTISRVIAIILFAVIAVNLFRVGLGFQAAGEVSNTIKLPIHPFAYSLGGCCFIQCFVLVLDITKIWEGKYE
jgi:TRAP-type C4-dicarboxylate transport system permease small subunit